MRHLKVGYRDEAILDLQNIYDIVFEMSQNRPTAKRFVSRIEDRCERIGFVPHGGRPRDDLEMGLRTVPFEHSAIIAHKVEHDRVRITNIFYGGRDYETFYLGALPDDGDFEGET